MRAFGASILVSLAASEAAGDFSLSFPVDCSLGSDCFIQQYVDHDPGPDSSDFTCGPLSYDGHNGTDIALLTTNAMEDGVSVLASAAGLVAGVRDGEPDTGLSGLTPGKECGNGVAIDHGNGWVTQYCHLKRGSLRVVPDQHIEAGFPIGDIGLSGKTEFPHVHVSVRHDGAIVDPFATEKNLDCGTKSGKQLWDTDIPYVPGGILTLGLSDSAPRYEAVKAGRVSEPAPSRNTSALVLYSHMFGTQAGDTLTLRLVWQGKSIFQQEIALDRTQARSFRAFGRKKPENGWPAGSYQGMAILERGGEAISQKRIHFEIR